MKMFWRSCLLLILLLFAAHPEVFSKDGQLVNNMTDLQAAIQGAVPGDVIIMADGIWMDATIHFHAEGEEGDSITLRAENPGSVILTGESRMTIEGSYLVVDGLMFRDGYLSHTGVVIEFLNGAHHSRLTNTVIMNYNPQNNGLSRDLRYRWVNMRPGATYNRLDHCYFLNKDHAGPTVVIRVGGANYHRIDHNYFGHRPPLGYNGGESLKIGTGAEAHLDSHILVEYNLFEECDGEIEIISNKAGNNHYRYNTFVGNDGTLTLRNGHRAIVEGNFFFGYGKSGSGGVRITGEDNIIFNNYFVDLEGEGARSALTMMNHYPDDSFPSGNMYNRIMRPVIAFNTFVNNKSDLFLGFRNLNPESLPIADGLIAHNILFDKQGIGPFVHIDGPLSNMSYQGNIYYGVSLGAVQENGFLEEDPGLELADDGLWRLTADSPAIGAVVDTAGSFDFIVEDMDGHTRDEVKDTGAEQFSNLPVVRQPLRPGDVGPSWISAHCYEVAVSVGEPVLSEPREGAMTSVQPDFEWEHVDWVSEYQLQIAKGNFLEQNIVLDTILTDSRMTLPFELEHTEIYRWRVRGMIMEADDQFQDCPWEIAQTGPWSDSYSFRTRRPVFIEQEGVIPEEFSLSGNYPNPFNSTSIIRYSLPVDSRVDLRVYDQLGRAIKVLVNQEQQSGIYRVVFDGSFLSSGIYHYRLQADAMQGMDLGRFEQMRSMTLVK